ncbi:MAG: helix-turn-helix domain-containing protein [Parcubacteria group bacterium]
MNLEKILIANGLSAPQAKLYLACLELGTATAYKISRKTGIHRSSCYEILDNLKEKGLISFFHKKGKKHFNAEDPRGIIFKTKENISLLEQALPQFNALYSTEKARPAVRYYEGANGMELILEEVLDEAKEILIFGSVEDYFANLQDYLPKFLEKRLKRKIPIRSIFRDSPKARARINSASEQLREARILPDKYEHHGLTVIWDKKIAMASFLKKEAALVIESEELAQMEKIKFYAIWDSLEK